MYRQQGGEEKERTHQSRKNKNISDVEENSSDSGLIIDDIELLGVQSETDQVVLLKEQIIQLKASDARIASPIKIIEWMRKYTRPSGNTSSSPISRPQNLPATSISTAEKTFTPGASEIT